MYADIHCKKLVIGNTTSWRIWIFETPFLVFWPEWRFETLYVVFGPYMVFRNPTLDFESPIETSGVSKPCMEFRNVCPVWARLPCCCIAQAPTAVLCECACAIGCYCISVAILNADYIAYFTSGRFQSSKLFGKSQSSNVIILNYAIQTF